MCSLFSFFRSTEKQRLKDENAKLKNTIELLRSEVATLGPAVARRRKSEEELSLQMKRVCSEIQRVRDKILKQ
jgi:hypothetical protein